MKYIKIYENKIDKKIWLFKATDLFDSIYSFSSFTKVFETNQDLENYFINLCNDIQKSIMERSEYNLQHKIKFNKYHLNNYMICKEFMYELSDTFGHSDVQTDIYEYEDIIGSNIQIRPDIQLSIDAKRYNL